MSDPKEINIYSAYNETFFNNAFGMLKLKNIFQNVRGTVSVEQLVKANPDVLIDCTELGKQCR